MHLMCAQQVIECYKTKKRKKGKKKERQWKEKEQR